jgi:mRNA-degrading endonuclease RelE of RelBE toxin-antitoxin system
VSDSTYVIELSATAEQDWLRFSEDEQEEITAWLRKLSQHPVPGERSGVFRMRGLNADGRPLYYSRTERFGIYHSINEQRVSVLTMIARPNLDIPQA